MMYVRTRYLCVCVAASDTAMVAGGVPLQKYSWGLVHSGAADVHAVGLALLGNLALLLCALSGFAAAFALTRRGVWFLLKRYASVCAQSSLAQRMRIPR